MTNTSLAASYLTKARARLKILPVLQEASAYSAWLRKEREFSFYGDIDFIPTEQYDPADADRAIADATFVVDVASRVIQSR
jgi:hypothetical protein